MRTAYVTEFFRYFVFSDPAWVHGGYDLANWNRDMGTLGAILDATSPDLERFKARDGRLILYHGWSDPALPALRSIRYYEAVESRDREVREYFRMFLLPGVLHCALGPGPDAVDWTRSILDWVENNRPPDRVIARKVSNGAIAQSRPLCPYPQRAEYRGSGPTDDEASFVCR
jgi:feruloyl esterase